ncbi:hypothetical protein ACA910_008799 [Epithemia clementina (nom. ined.)]
MKFRKDKKNIEVAILSRGESFELVQLNPLGMKTLSPDRRKRGGDTAAGNGNSDNANTGSNMLASRLFNLPQQQHQQKQNRHRRQIVTRQQLLQTLTADDESSTTSTFAETTHDGKPTTTTSSKSTHPQHDGHDDQQEEGEEQNREAREDNSAPSVAVDNVHPSCALDDSHHDHPGIHYGEREEAAAWQRSKDEEKNSQKSASHDKESRDGSRRSCNDKTTAVTTGTNKSANNNKTTFSSPSINVPSAKASEPLGSKHPYLEDETITTKPENKNSNEDEKSFYCYIDDETISTKASVFTNQTTPTQVILNMATSPIAERKDEDFEEEEEEDDDKPSRPSAASKERLVAVLSMNDNVFELIRIDSALKQSLMRLNQDKCITPEPARMPKRQPQQTSENSRTSKTKNSVNGSKACVRHARAATTENEHARAAATENEKHEQFHDDNESKHPSMRSVVAESKPGRASVSVRSHENDTADDTDYDAGGDKYSPLPGKHSTFWQRDMERSTAVSLPSLSGSNPTDATRQIDGKLKPLRQRQRRSLPL